MRSVPLRDVVLGEGRTKVIVPLTGRTADELLGQCADLAGQPADIVEWRVDFLAGAADPSQIGAIVAAGAAVRETLERRPLLVTCRTAAEGGEQDLAAPAYRDLLMALIGAGIPDALDVEHRLDDGLVAPLIAAAHDAGIAVVLSCHDFAGTPQKDEIVATLRAMQDRGADIAKVAVMPHSPWDVLTLLEATWEMSSLHAERPIITVSMGAPGAVSRMIGEVFGSCATFASVGRASAPGQLPIDQLTPVLHLVHEARS